MVPSTWPKERQHASRFTTILSPSRLYRYSYLRRAERDKRTDANITCTAFRLRLCALTGPHDFSRQLRTTQEKECTSYTRRPGRSRKTFSYRGLMRLSGLTHGSTYRPTDRQDSKISRHSSPQDTENYYLIKRLKTLINLSEPVTHTHIQYISIFKTTKRTKLRYKRLKMS